MKYDTSGKVVLTPSLGSGYTGRFSPDGSMYYTVDPDTGFCGLNAPDGSIYVKDVSSSSYSGRLSPNGSLRVTSLDENNGALKVSGLTAPVASWNASTSTLAQLLALASHSRPSLAMMFDSTGKLTYAPNNLLTYSNTFNNAAWTLVSATVSGSTLTPVAANSSHRIFQSTSAASGSNYIATFVLKPNGYSKVAIVENDLTGNYVSFDMSGARSVLASSGAIGSITQNADGSYTISHASASGGATFRPDLYILSPSYTTGQPTGSWTADGVSGIVLWSQASLSRVTYETSPRSGDQVITTSAAYYGPRIDYDPNTLAVKGLLIEAESRTNLQPVSDLSASTTLNAATVATGQPAPDGTTGARKIIADVTAGFHYATQALATTSGVLYSTSFFAYAPDAGYTLVGGASNTGGIGTFDLATGTATSGTNMAASMRQVGTLAGKPVYKCVWQWTAAANNNQAYFYAPNALNTIAASAGNGTSGVVIWGVQTEAGAKDTSLIVTNGSAVTRAPDIVTLTGPAIAAASSSAATLISEWDAVNASFSFSSPSIFVANGGYPLLRANNATTLLSTSAAGNSQTLTVSAGTFSNNYRVGVAYSASGFSLGVNGATATSALSFTSPTTVYVGGAAGTANLTGNNHLRSFAIYNQRLSDATLQAKSVVGAW